MGQQEIEGYLNHLANRRTVSASTQSGALNAIAFRYRAVLKMDMPCLKHLRRIRRHQTIPVVMSVREIQATFSRMSGTTRFMAEIIYGSGMRIGECVTLRVKDIDFDSRTITVRAGKGNIDRTTLMPETLIPSLRNDLMKVAQLHKSRASAYRAGSGSMAGMPGHLPAFVPLGISSSMGYVTSALGVIANV